MMTKLSIAALLCAIGSIASAQLNCESCGTLAPPTPTNFVCTVPNSGYTGSVVTCETAQLQEDRASLGKLYYNGAQCYVNLNNAIYGRRWAYGQAGTLTAYYYLADDWMWGNNATAAQYPGAECFVSLNQTTAFIYSGEELGYAAGLTCPPQSSPTTNVPGCQCQSGLTWQGPPYPNAGGACGAAGIVFNLDGGIIADVTVDPPCSAAGDMWDWKSFRGPPKQVNGAAAGHTIATVGTSSAYTIDTKATLIMTSTGQPESGPGSLRFNRGYISDTFEAPTTPWAGYQVQTHITGCKPGTEIVYTIQLTAEP